MAITDHGNMYGAIEFFKLAKKEGIKPILGVEAYVANRGRLDKEPGIDNKRYHLILLAKNLTGYKNLIRLVSISGLEGYYYKPRMDKEILRTYSEGIIALSGCMGGELSSALMAGNDEHAERNHQRASGHFRQRKLFSRGSETSGPPGRRRAPRKINCPRQKIRHPARRHHRLALSVAPTITRPTRTLPRHPRPTPT